MLTHDFYQVSPENVELMDEERLLDYVVEREDILPCMRISDKIILRNRGRIDKIGFIESDLDTYTPGKMRFFSGFLNMRTENHTVGINYYGTTLMDCTVLKQLIDCSGHICFIDILPISRFKKYCRETMMSGKWIIHFGV